MTINRAIRRTCLMAWLATCGTLPAAGQGPALLPSEEMPGDAASAPEDMPPEDVAPSTDPETEAILRMDIEQLGRVDVVVPSMDVEVTSVTRTESTVGRSPAAVFVITPEMIRRSGATSIPEVLRMVPGLEVARVNSNQWAITCRGFNDRFANKLLVQIDGRSIYTPTFSGVYWEAHHVVLQDVERIEVIRGPGATVWGANAVNGVINIITKNSKDTQGLMLSGVAGTEDRGITSLRYGGTTEGSVSWRVYGMQFDRGRGTFSPAMEAAEGPTRDDWRLEQTGFRADWAPSCCDTVTVQGDYFNGDLGHHFDWQAPTPPYDRHGSEDVRISGGNLLARWSRDLGEDQGWAAQAYYDRFEHHFSLTADDTDTIDFDFQYQLPLGERHKLISGCGYRYYKIRTLSTFALSYDPPGRDLDVFSYFLQDQITLRPDRLFLTIGSKFEHNDFTAFEFQPTARLLWAPQPRRAMWTSISRAVRTPSFFDEGGRLKIFNVPVGPPPPIFAQFNGDRTVESEDLTAYEAGYRAQPSDAFSWDVTAFFNKYEDLIVFNPAPLGFPPAPIWPWTAVAGMNGEIYGTELSATLQVNPCWRLTGSYSFLQIQLHPYAGIDPEVDHIEHHSPHNRVYFRSSWDLVHDLELDLMLRYADSLHTHTGIDPGVVPSYLTMDVRLGWRPSDRFEAAVVGRNLLDAHHSEFTGTENHSTQVDRGVYGTVTWRY